MKNLNCCIFHPQPSGGGLRFESPQILHEAEVPFRGFRGKENKEYDDKTWNFIK